MSDHTYDEGMSPEEAAIIWGAIENADCWGAGRLSTAKNAMEMEGYTWTEKHERYLYDCEQEDRDESNSR